MQNLLFSGNIKKEGKGLEINLYQLSGKPRPQINNIETYHWALQVKGTKKYSHLEELRVDFSFFGKDGYIDSRDYEIIDYIPRRETEDKATLELTVPQFIKVSIPIKQEKIVSEKMPTKIEWTFKDINLSNSDTLSRAFEGIVSVRFYRESIMKNIGIAISVFPEFYEKQLYFRKIPCTIPLRIDHEEVKNMCNCIIPGDLASGFADLEKPETKKMFIYDFLINEGILIKGSGKDEIRNVSLRARTLSILFDNLKSELGYQDYYKIIKSAGRQIGSNFADELEKLLGHSPTFQDWFDYDSSAGMGRFEINEQETEIIVKNSFLAYEHKKKSEKPVCCFLEGYFEPLLNKILSREDVVVAETTCKAQGSEYCKFKII